MDINELQSYRLSDAVKFNDQLNPRLWGSDEHLLPEVKDKLMAIADDFREFLGITDLEIKDITISGSNAAYTYTPHSDIDLHLVVDLPKADISEVYRELFDAKKYAYNDQHDYKIGGYDVELYVQNANEPHYSQGIYSIKDDEWKSVPKRRKPEIDDISVKSKYEDLGQRIEAAIRSGDLSKMDAVAKKVKDLRGAGLEKTGEFGPENLAFKVLRNNGTLDSLRAARLAAKDSMMSLDERKKKKKSGKKFKYGAFGGYYFPGYGYYGQTDAAADGGGDGGGGESVKESAEPQDIEGTLRKFIEFAAEQVGIESMPQIKFKRDPAWSERNNTFGRYIPEENTLYVSLANRHPFDIMRTVAHELIHHRQNEIEPMPIDSGDTGSDWENEANAGAGIIMRRFSDLHPEQFGESTDEPVTTTVNYDIPYTAIARPERLWNVRRYGEVSHYKSPKSGMAMISVPVSKEQQFVDAMGRQGISVKRSQVYEASGYIPTAAEKNDPRFSMALTVDVHPGQTGKEANKLGLKTDSQGRPALLMKKLGNLLESVKAGEDTLLEVKMSPGELQRWAQSPEAEGIQAGFEAELIFRNTQRDEDGESEPDYDQDERAYSIDGIIDFFQSGDNGIGRNQANRLRDRLYEEWYDWQVEQIDAEWDKEAEERVEQWMRENVWNEDTYRENARRELGSEASDDEVAKRAEELFQEDVEQATTRRHSNDNWQEAYTEFSDEMREDSDLDEEAWLQDAYRYMSDVQNGFELDWPYWTEVGGYGNGRSVEDIADSLSSALDGARVVGSTGYHSTKRRPGQWIIEPDGSLDPDDSEDAGLEVVSPPMPLPEALAALKKVTDWANDSNEGNAYTNSSTGLHMGISIPHKGGDVDYVKLILFLGDQYILDKFGRAANSYTRSALEKLRTVQKSRRRNVREADQMSGTDKTAAAMDLMRKNLIELAQKYVQDGVGQDKYTSAHIKPGYIEFRSPGGDYLDMNDQDENALANTMLRFARAMYIAGRPDLERKEYAKKLYQLIDSQGDDSLKLFMDYTTGKINRDELKKDWARQVLAKEQPVKTSQDYEVYDKETGETLETISIARDQEHDHQTSRLIADTIEKYSSQDIKIGFRQVDEPEAEPSRRVKVAKKITDRPADQKVDNAQDSRDLQSRLQGSGGPRWRVTWTERRDGRIVDDAYTIEADNGADAMDKIRRTLGYQGREAISMSVEPAPLAGSTVDRAQQRAAAAAPFNTVVIYNPRTGQEFETFSGTDYAIAQRVMDVERQQGVGHGLFRYRPAEQEQQTTPAATGQQREYYLQARGDRTPILGFMAASDEEALDRLRRYRLEHPDADVSVRTGGTSTPAQQAQQPQQQGEFSGSWQIKDATGQILHTFGGVGNSQADANRFAARWLGTNRPDLAGQEVNVVPEMR